MNVKKIQAKHIAHGIMCVFAIASLFNIEDFVFTIHANKPLSWAVAVALSAALVIFAALLSEMRWGGRGFWIMLAVVAGLTIVSGAIQGASYAAHTNAVAGWLMGFSLPLFGELGASLALSVYTKEQQARSMAEAQKQLADGVRRNIIEALGNTDKTKIEAQVNKAVGLIARELIDASVSDMIAELRSGRAQIAPFVAEIDATPTIQIEQKSASVDEISPILSAEIEPELSDVDRMKAGKQRKIDARRTTMLAILRSGECTVGDLATKLEVSPNTIRTDLDALQQAGHSMIVNGVVKLK